MTNDAPQEIQVSTIAATNPVATEDPDVAGFGSGDFRNCRNDLVVRIVRRLQCNIDLSRGKPGQRQIEIDVKRANFIELEPQDLEIPSGIEGDLVIGKPKCLLLRLGQASQCNRWNIGQAEFFGGSQSSVTRDEHARFVDQDRIGESEFPDRSDELLDLTFGMGSRIARIRLERTGRTINDLQLMRRGAHPRVVGVHAFGT